MNVATLAAQADLYQWDGITRLPETANQTSNSMLITDHIHQCASDFVCSHLGGLYDHEDPKFHAANVIEKTPARTRRAIYKRFVYCELHYTHQDSDIQAKLQLRGLPLADDAVPWMHQHFRFMSSRLQPNYRNIQFDLLFNSLSTDRRYRHVSGTSKQAVHACYLCGLEDDSIGHLFTGACLVVVQARRAYSNHVNIDLSPAVLHGADFHHSS